MVYLGNIFPSTLGITGPALSGNIVAMNWYDNNTANVASIRTSGALMFRATYSINGGGTLTFTNSGVNTSVATSADLVITSLPFTFVN